MHTEYYGLHEHPFQMTPNARLYFASSVHRRAHAHLTYGLAQHEGFIVVTGEVGAGKTTLIERLCDELDPHDFVIARITTTLVSGDDVLRMVADAFGAEPEGNKAAVLRGIAAALRHSNRRHLLIVDEAQGLVPDALEELRMLSNLTHPGQPPLQTLLMGQPQLRRLLVSPALAQLRQRVLASYHLGGLTREETHAYVMHRLRAVGWAGRPSWGAGALDLVHAYSDGLPRRINRLCARVMLSGALEGQDHLTADMVTMVAQELEQDLGGGAMLRVPAPRGADAVRGDMRPADEAPGHTRSEDFPPPPHPAAAPPAVPTNAGQTWPVEEPPAEQPPLEEPPPAPSPAEPPLQEPPAETPPVEEPRAEAVPAEEMPVEERPAAEPSVEELPAGVSPVQELPADDTPIEEQPPVQELALQDQPSAPPPVEEPTTAAAPEPQAETAEAGHRQAQLRLPSTLVPMSFATAGATARTLLPEAMIPPEAVRPVVTPMLTSEAEVMFDTLTRPPPAPPIVPTRRREEEPERLFNWVFKLLPNHRSRR